MSSTNSIVATYCCSSKKENDEYMGGLNCLDCGFRCCLDCIEDDGLITPNQRCLACYEKNYPEAFKEEYGVRDYDTDEEEEIEEIEEIDEIDE